MPNDYFNYPASPRRPSRALDYSSASPDPSKFLMFAVADLIELMISSA